MIVFYASLLVWFIDIFFHIYIAFCTIQICKSEYFILELNVYIVAYLNVYVVFITC